MQFQPCRSAAAELLEGATKGRRSFRRTIIDFLTTKADDKIKREAGALPAAMKKPRRRHSNLA
jgi:hypothetical protein